LQQSTLPLLCQELLRSRFLRKHCATVSQLLDLKGHELDWLARHMGHHIAVHRQFYCLHQKTLELTKVSRILDLLERGAIGRFQGNKSIDEICLEELETETAAEEEADEDDVEEWNQVDASATAHGE
jgi:hypothetical protein